MPEIITHHYFAKDVKQKTNRHISKILNKEERIYTLFSMGFDPFFFYELLPFRKKLGNFCHTNLTDTFFLIFIKKIKEQHFEKNPVVLSCLYGHLTHYILDSTLHPYIVYKTGFYNKEKQETRKYNGLHTKFEKQIDVYLYEQKNKIPYKNFKIHKELITKEKFDKDLISLLNEIYQETFSIQNGGKKYQKGYKDMYYFCKFLLEDKYGIKKQIYKIFDKFTPKKKGVFENFSTYVININRNILNEKHKTWYNPWNKQESTESFFDLYNKALDTCTTLFEATDKFINNQMTEKEYKKVLKDNSYVTGLSWHIKGDIKYLEF